MKIHRRAVLTQLAAMATAQALPSWAQTAWPSPTKIVVPFPAGGGVDVMVRRLAEALAKQLNAAVIIDNKPGASGLIAVQAAIKSPTDGSSFLYVHNGIITSQAITGRMDVLKDFKMVSKLSTGPHALTVPGNSPYKTVGELMAAIKKNPGKLNYGHGGSGSPSHLAFEMLDDKVPGGLNATAIPFKGAIESVVAMLSGDIDFAFVLPVSVVEHIKTGKLRVLATTGTSRLPLLPQIATFAESGVPGFSAEPWGGFAVPAGTSDAVVEQFLQALKATVALPEVAEMFIRTGGRVDTSASPAAFTSFVREELEHDKKLVAKLGLKAD